MFEENLPESDSSDEDFVPTGAGGSDLSEEESDNAVDEEENDSTPITKRKRTRKTNSSKGKRKKKMTSDDEAPDEARIEEKKPEESAEEKKRHADALWADFMKDCGPTVKKQPEQTCTSNNSTVTMQPTPKPKSNSAEDCSRSDFLNSTGGGTSTLATLKESSSSDKVVEVYEFAGEKVIVERKMDPKKKISRGGSGGVAAILSQINKKGKLSTLEKSKLDWQGFKDREGINEDLSAHNKGKNGFLERQEFLERSDLRQFKLEKEMRAHIRSKRL